MSNQIETISLYIDGNLWCAAMGSYPACTSPEVEKAFGETRADALSALAILVKA